MIYHHILSYSVIRLDTYNTTIEHKKATFVQVKECNHIKIDFLGTLN